MRTVETTRVEEARTREHEVDEEEEDVDFDEEFEPLYPTPRARVKPRFAS